MANIVLVHGSGCGGWVWHKLTPSLRALGHSVYAPSLTGLADRKHLLNEQVDLTTHITDIVNLIIYEDLQDVILVGNSYGGMVISGVAARITNRFRLLVYLDAYLPDDGQSEADLLPAEMLAARRKEAEEHGGTNAPPPPGIFGISDPGLAEWVQSRMTPHPFRTYTEAIHWEEQAMTSIPGLFIHCTGNPPTTPDLFAASAMRARSKGWPVIDLPAGHLAMLTDPQSVAEILLEAI